MFKPQSDAKKTLATVYSVFFFTISLAVTPFAQSQPTLLTEYYIHYCQVYPDECPSYPGSRPSLNPPQIVTRENVTSGNPDSGYRIDLYAEFSPTPTNTFSYLRIFAEGSASISGTIGSGPSCINPILPVPLITGSTSQRNTIWFEGGSTCGDNGTSPEVLGEWAFNDTFRFGEPVRKLAADGSAYDASPMTQRRNGQPWLTLYWGYKLGLVESQFDWDATALSVLPAFKGWRRYAPKSEEIMLLKLPPPIVEGEVTEYVNTENFPNDPGGHYYYASNDETRAILDSGRPGKWFRTGKGFKHGGYVSVCRFYGSVSPGPNSHFYTASDNECSVLKSLEAKPMPSNKQQFNFEGVAFYANVPIPSKAAGQPATCPTQSIPLYRAYNAAWGPSGKKNYDSNHRFSTSRADIDAVVAKGWNDEGMVMCVPA
jgi:Repeat of unknown function (DUF5648)